MKITLITSADIDEWLEMSLALWPEEEAADMLGFLELFIREDKFSNFMARNEDGKSAGFINLSLRSDYVEGMECENPVAYIEGIYVRPEYRSGGVAALLVAAGEAWGRQEGCNEIASDAYADNADSRAFHASMGFNESKLIVVFGKKI